MSETMSDADNKTGIILYVLSCHQRICLRHICCVRLLVCWVCPIDGVWHKLLCHQAGLNRDSKGEGMGSHE